MTKINLNFQTGHQCRVIRKGEWVTLTCPLCPGWWRQHNLITGQVEGSKNYMHIQHTGWYQELMQ